MYFWKGREVHGNSTAVVVEWCFVNTCVCHKEKWWIPLSRTDPPWEAKREAPAQVHIQCSSNTLWTHSLGRGAGQVPNLHPLLTGADQVSTLCTRSGEVHIKCAPCALILEWCRSRVLVQETLSAHLDLAWT